MAGVFLFDAARMQEIEDTTVVAGFVDVDGHLLLEQRNGTQINAGLVKGADGEDGEDGDNGLSAYEVWLADGNVGTVDDYLASLKGETGDTGLPAGSVMAWVISTIPTNWLECNGQAVSRTTYADLFAVIGVTHGPGNGTTTFNLPDYRGRVIVGQDTADADFDVLGEAFGVKTHLLTAAQSGVPAHIHGLPGHTFNWGIGYSPNGVVANAAVATAGSPSGNALSTQQGVFNASSNNSAANAAQAHPNVQPSRVAKWIIKATGGIGTISNSVDTILTNRLAELETYIGNKVKKNAAATALSAGVWTIFANPANFDTEIAANGMAAFNGTFVIPETGLYKIEGSVHVASATTIIAACKKNEATGSAAGIIASNTATGAAGYTSASFSTEVPLVAGDVLRLAVYCNAATTVDVGATTRGDTYFGIRKVNLA